MWAGDLEKDARTFYGAKQSAGRFRRNPLRGNRGDCCVASFARRYLAYYIPRSISCDVSLGSGAIVLLISAQLLGFGARLFDQIPSKLQFWIPTSAPILRAKAPPKRPPGPIPRPTSRAPGVPPSCPVPPELPLLGPSPRNYVQF